jgi:hypothetical protein
MAEPPFGLVGWSRFRAVLMLSAFYLRQRSVGMARKFGKVTNQSGENRGAFSEIISLTGSKVISLADLDPEVHPKA